MLLLTNELAETARNLIVRYAGRNSVEEGLGNAVDFFHLDCLCSDVPLNADLDAVLTVLAHGCYRWLAQRLKGHEKSRAKQLYRHFVETAGQIEVGEDRIVIHLERRSHNPVLRAAALDLPRCPVPWLGNRFVCFSYA